MGLSNGVMGLFGLGIGAAGTAADSYYAAQQAQADNAAAEWNAGMMEDNAKLKELQAGQALEKGRHDVAIAKREGALRIEGQRAAYAGSGVVVDSGSALDVVAEQAGRNRYDQDMLDYNAKLSAWGHNVEAANLRQQATMTRATKRSPAAAAGASLLAGGTNMYDRYSRYQLYRG